MSLPKSKKIFEIPYERVPFANFFFLPADVGNFLADKRGRKSPLVCLTKIGRNIYGYQGGNRFLVLKRFQFVFALVFLLLVSLETSEFFL